MDPTRSAVRVDARLELDFERRGDRTILARSYAEPPFHIGRSFALDDAAYVIIVCTGPGVFAGDRLTQTVRVGRGARVVLTSQSALQVHPSSAAESASIDHRYILDDDAELHAEWDPVIPFAGSRVAQRFAIDMPSSARLAWGDAVMAGRVTRGETWRFRELSHELRLAVDGHLLYLERYRLAPEARDPARPWIAGDATYFATSLVRHDRATADRAEALHHSLGAIDGVRAAADLTDRGLIVARILSARGVPFAAARAACRRLTLEDVFESPQLAGRKSV